MKKRVTVKACAATQAATESISVKGADMSSLYIDMLCEKFKDRGIRTSGASAANAERYRKMTGAQEKDNSSYKSMNINGRSYMSSDDFAAYYRDLRDYKMPRFYSRAESEYEAARAQAERNVQESGNPPKKLYGLL